MGKILKYEEFINESNNERDYSFTLTKEQYDYLLPIYGLATSNTKMLHKYDSKRKIDTYYFIGTEVEYKEALNRCKYMK